MTLEIYLPFIKPIIYLIFLVLITVVIKLLSINYRYKKSKYHEVSGNNFWSTAFSKGNYGEFLTFIMLEKLQGENRLLSNLYIPKEDGTNTEIDLLMINKTGLYVFESKNYSGWIFGDEKSKTWMQSLNGGKKNKFFNPIWQNKGHINALANVLKDIESIFMFSYIVFSERCELKKVSFTSENVAVVKRNRLLPTLKSDINKRVEILSSSQITDLYELLKTYTHADDNKKKQHIESIRNKVEKLID